MMTEHVIPEGMLEAACEAEGANYSDPRDCAYVVTILEAALRWIDAHPEYLEERWPPSK